MRTPDGIRHFTLTFSADHLKVEERRNEGADLRLAASVETMVSWLFGGAAVTDLMAAGKLRLTGSRRQLSEICRALGLGWRRATRLGSASNRPSGSKGPRP